MIVLYLVIIYLMISFLAGTIAVKLDDGARADSAQEAFWTVAVFWPLILPVAILYAPVYLINKYVDFISKS